MSWQPTAPLTDVSQRRVMDDMAAAFRDAAAEIIRSENEALKQVAYYAQRDGHGMVIERWGGRVVDAHVSKYIPSGEAYIMEMDRMGVWDSLDDLPDV